MAAPSNASDATDDGVGFFDLAGEEDSGAAEPGRVQALKRMLFDLSYLLMNADGTEHISERMLTRKLESRMEKEGSVDTEARANELAPLLEKGPDAIRDRIETLATELAQEAGDRTQAVGERYLDFLKGLIVADASVSEEEYEVFEMLCDKWGVDKDLPRA